MRVLTYKDPVYDETGDIKTLYGLGESSVHGYKLGSTSRNIVTFILPRDISTVSELIDFLNGIDISVENPYPVTGRKSADCTVLYYGMVVIDNGLYLRYTGSTTSVDATDFPLVKLF